jgi:hypothetical protein
MCLVQQTVGLAPFLHACRSIVACVSTQSWRQGAGAAGAFACPVICITLAARSCLVIVVVKLAEHADACVHTAAAGMSSKRRCAGGASSRSRRNARRPNKQRQKPR